ncbi:DEAD/DEAH box helicase [Mesobacillus zeae]|uniref:DEAD/DEAH box helicase n=1 Tax=Mesobacillus zeae TaxID=1917180 RepID=A0A398B6G8_9BACI|nr:DEAD/DEAH box helicase [Mesobacillus zeae]RID85699.1 DEAD/DEAH box helicase [Mesobacillus zeae]
MTDFSDLGLSEELKRKLLREGISVPTPVQEKTIPKMLEGKELIVQAMTGSGKTLAFVLPILEQIKPGAGHIQALVVTPTRELALQITNETKKMAGSDISVLAVYGGQDVDKQLKKLEKCVDIVISTPGRLLDHMRRGTVDLSQLSCLVLDEADQMLHIGFLPEVEEIIDAASPDRKTMLFSATMPSEVRDLARKYIDNPEYIQVERTQGPAVSVKQSAVFTTDRAKFETLVSLVNEERPFMAVIFCRTKRRASKLYDNLKGKGFSCDELHGDLSQGKREKVMKRFRDAEIQLLVATDVAARGLDVEGVTHVFNYDIPLDAESYVHRIGRTGRAGSEGMAITLFAQKDKQLLHEIEKDLKIKIRRINEAREDEVQALPAKKSQAGRRFADDRKKRSEGPSARKNNSKSSARPNARSGKNKWGK